LAAGAGLFATFGNSTIGFACEQSTSSPRWTTASSSSCGEARFMEQLLPEGIVLKLLYDN